LRIIAPADTIIISSKTPKEVILKWGIECAKCGHCCRFGSGYLLDEDIREISKRLGISEDDFKRNYAEEKKRFNTTVFQLKTIKPNARKNYGQCIFFDEGRQCLIHEAKPLYCRITNCKPHCPDVIQWFDLNYTVRRDDPESIRQWNSFLRFKEPIPGGRIEDLVPDSELRVKILGYEIFGEEDLAKFREERANKK